MLKTTLVLILLLMPLFAYSEESWQISAEEWTRPRHGEWLAQHPALGGAVMQLQQEPQSRLQLRYPGGDEGVLWAEELQSWLVALGIASSRLELVPGSSRADVIQLNLVQ